MPDEPKAQPAAHPHSDDTVSLRDLYLVFRAGLPLVLVVAVICAAASLLYQSSRPVTYTATAVVKVARPSVSDPSSLGLQVGVSPLMDTDSYAAIANDRSVLEQVMRAVGAQSPQGLGRTAVRPGPGPRAADSFHVTHSVTRSGADGAEKAARVANLWAEATVEAVRRALSGPWTTTGAMVAADVAAREAAYQAASEAWAEFQAKDERDELRRRLDALVDIDAARTTRLDAVESQAAGTRARLATATPVARVQLQDELAALEAEADHLRGELESSRAQAAELRSRLAALEREAASLQRAVSTASIAYFNAAPTQTAIQLQEALAQSAVSVLLPAQPPFEPDGRQRLLNTVAVAVVGGLLATLFVFLRAAVRDPAKG